MKPHPTRIPLWLRITIALAILLGASLIIYFILSQRQIARSNAEAELAVIAELKVNQITNWREERLADAEVLKENPLFQSDWTLDLNDERKAYLEAIMDQHQLCNIVLVEPDSMTSKDLNGNTIDIHLPAMDIMQESILTDEIHMSDMHAGACNDSIHIDIAVPLLDAMNGQNFIILLQMRTDDFLYPLLQNWPTTSTTGETLLIEQIGDEVIFLNDLRHVEDAALSLKIPVTEDHVPAIMAVKGITGSVIGIDYRDEPVMAVIQPVPDTEWYMISKMDLKEINQRWIPRTTAIILAVVLFVISIITGASGFWQRDEKMLAMGELEAEKALKESEERFRTYVENAPDGIFVANAKGQYTEVNQAACSLTGYSRDELLKMNLMDLIPEEGNEKAAEHFSSLVKKGTAIDDIPYVTKSGEKRIWNVKAVKINEDSFMAFTTDVTKRKQLMAELEELQYKYDLTLDVTDEGIWEWDLKTDEVIWSEKLEQLLGEENQKHTFSSWGDRLHPEDQENTVEALNAHLRGDTPMWQAEYRIRVADGSWLWMLGKGRVIEFDQQNQPTRMVGTISDITGIKILQSLLDYRRQQLEKVLDIIPVGIWLADDKGDLYFANREAVRIWGEKKLVPAQEYDVFKAWRLPSKTPIQPDEWSILKSVFDGVETENELIEIESFNGEKRTLVINTSPLFDAQGNIEGAIEVNFDITNLVLLRDELSFQERQFERVLDLLPVGVWIADETGTLIKSNPMGPKIWGAEPHVGMEEYGVFSARRLPSNEPIAPEDWALAHTINEGVTVEGELLEIDGFDGVKRIIENFTAPMLDENGKVEGAIVVNNDITSLHETQEKIRQLNAELEERVKERTAQLQTANEEMESFVYSVSHDLRAPLRAIDGYSHMLSGKYEELLDENGLRFLNRISENIRRMNLLIDGLLNLSRVNRTKIEFETLDMQRIAKRVVRESQMRWLSPHEIVIGELPTVKGNEVMVQQVWQNLLDNAVKYSRNSKNPEIVVSSSIDGEFVTFSVKDNGIGFDNQYANQLFGVFERLSTSPDVEGMGIGLAIVKKIIERHGGKVWAEGKEGEGATFYFTLPKA